MDANAPSTVSATANVHGPVAQAASMALTPSPKKNTSIMLRRPHRSPQRPAGIEPSPNIRNAPAP